MNTYAIGDIHGCLRELEKLLRFLEPELNSDDRLIFMGDYIDRGENSKGVVDLLLNLKEQRDCTFLLGNHEDFLMHWIGAWNYDPGIGNYWTHGANGGQATMRSYGCEPPHFTKKDLPKGHFEFFQGLLEGYIEENLLFVHAGISWGAYAETDIKEALMRSERHDTIWDRSTLGEKPGFPGTLVCGHTPQKNGVRYWRNPDGTPFHVCIDVGTVFGCNPLTAVRVNDWTEWKDDS